MILAVFKNNNFDIGSGTQALFRDICRINHSCVPNSQGNFNTSIGSFTIHAVRPIEESEEITISYLDEHGAVRASRQKRLFEGHGFECTCEICDPNMDVGRKSEERRSHLRDRIRAAAERIPLDEKKDMESGLNVLHELIRTFEEDGLAGRELSTM